MTPSIGREYITCESCKKTNPQKRCARCRTNYYCSASCQKAHWRSGHKHECQGLQAARDNSVGFVSNNDDVEEEEEVECFICLSKDVLDPYVIADCGHAYCFGCLVQWRERTRRIRNSHADTDSFFSDCPACLFDKNSIPTKALLFASRVEKGDLAFRAKVELELESLLQEISKFEDDHDNLNKVIMSYFLRAEIWLLLQEPIKVEQDLQELLRIHRQGMENSRCLNEMIERGQQALEEGRYDDAMEIKIDCEEFRETNYIIMGLSQSSIVYLYVLLARAKEMKQDLDGAHSIYDKMTTIIKNNKSYSEIPSSKDDFHLMELWTQLSRYAYTTGKYEMAIMAGNEAIQRNRHWPGIRKFVALSEKACGNEETAKAIAAQAVHYESPFDEQHKLTVMQLYDEI